MPTTATSIDWTALARSLGSITCENEDGRTERGGTDLARLALNALLGDEELVMAVSHYIDFRPATDLFSPKTIMIYPGHLVSRCYGVFVSEEADSYVAYTRAIAIGLILILTVFVAVLWLLPESIPEAGAECSPKGKVVCVEGRQYVCHQDSVYCGGGNCIGAVIGGFFLDDPVWVASGHCE